MEESKIINYVKVWPDKPSVEKLYLKEKQNLKKTQIDPYNSPYRYVLKTLSVIGMTCKRGNNNNFFLKNYWDTFMLFLVSATTFFTVAILGSVNMSAQVLYIFYTYLMLAFAVRLLFLRKRRDFYAVIVKMIKINLEDLEVEPLKCQQCSRRSMMIFYVWVSIVTIFLILYSFKITPMDRGYRFFGIKLSESEMGAFMYILPICMAFSSISSSFTIAISLITSGNLYYSAKNLLEAFGDKLNLTSMGCVTKESLCFCLSLYKKIMLCFIDIDSFVSIFAMLLYATAITCFFNTVSTCFFFPEQVMKDTILLGQIGVSFFLGLAIFTMLTYRGSKANAEYNNLKTTLIELMDSTTDHCFSVETATMLNTLTDCIMLKSPNFTVGGMFTINCSLILTTLGAMITYGALIF